ncbi:hypothetical protein C8Q74DRAFT_1308511 [Fomes fomentarius]|nr:hypothetical protein C8Q74DRAFT_1308511 [Fomes fomentarius]
MRAQLVPSRKEGPLLCDARENKCPISCATAAYATVCITAFSYRCPIGPTTVFEGRSWGERLAAKRANEWRARGRTTCPPIDGEVYPLLYVSIPRSRGRSSLYDSGRRRDALPSPLQLRAIANVHMRLQSIDRVTGNGRCVDDISTRSGYRARILHIYSRQKLGREDENRDVVRRLSYGATCKLIEELYTRQLHNQVLKGHVFCSTNSRHDTRLFQESPKSRDVAASNIHAR